MKNTKFKKGLSLVFALTFTLTSFASVAASAEAAQEDSLDDHLVIHYDFEGADILEAMEDKATAGAYKDDLSPKAGGINFSGLNVDPTNGTVKNTKGGAGLATTNVSDDVKAVAGLSTWFIRFKLDKIDNVADGTYNFIVDMRNFGDSEITRPYMLIFEPYDNKLWSGSATAEEPNKAANTTPVYEYNYEAGEYLNVATVMQEVEIEGVKNYQIVLYVSEGLAKTAEDWTRIGAKVIGTSLTVPNANNINILCSNNGAASCLTGITIDDVRLYNTNLSLEQIASIIPEASLDGQIKNVYTPSTGDDGNTNTNGSGTAGNAGSTDNTAADTADTTADTTEAPTTEDTSAAETEAEKGGCGSSIGIGGVAIISTLGIAFAVKKKED